MSLLTSPLMNISVRMVAKYSGEIMERVLKSFGLMARKSELLSSSGNRPTDIPDEVDRGVGKAVGARRTFGRRKTDLAFAILDGLAKSAGRQIPTLIDSLLPSRWNSSAPIAQHYLPRASHLPIVFSTDKEVDKRMVESLKDNIAASYLLTFNERDHGTEIKSGY